MKILKIFTEYKFYRILSLIITEKLLHCTNTLTKYQIHVNQEKDDEDKFIVEGIASWGAFYNRRCAFTYDYDDDDGYDDDDSYHDDLYDVYHDDDGYHDNGDEPLNVTIYI